MRTFAALPYYLSVTSDCNGSCTPGLYQAISDALPCAVFVVGPHLSIKDFNDAAIQLPEDVLLTVVRPDWEGERIGDVMHYVNSTDGCGNSSACHRCVIVNSAAAMFATGRPQRKIVPMHLLRGGTLRTVEHLVTIANVKVGDESAALMGVSQIRK